MIIKATDVKQLLELVAVVALTGIFWFALTNNFWCESVPVVSDELPEGYFVNGYGRSTDSSGTMHGEYVSIFHRYHHLYQNESCRLHDGIEVKFCGFSDSQCWAGPKVLLSFDGLLLETEQEIPNSDYYVSSRNTENESIRIGWSIELKKGETASLLFDEAEVTFLGSDENGEPIFKVTY